MFTKIVSGFLCSALFACTTTTALALPPLGLTQVSTSPTLQPNLELIDGSAYLGVADGVWTINTLGSQTFLPISHPALGTPSSVTRVVKATDGEFYVAANFNSFTNQAAAALFPLNQPSNPVVTWELPRIRVSGVDVNLYTFGGFDYDDGDEATKFLMDGSTEPLPYPPGSNSSNNTTRLVSVTPSGYALGSAGIPATIGSSPVLWAPNEDISFIFGNGEPFSIRDRIDGNGVNVGSNLLGADVLLGTSEIAIKDENGIGFLLEKGSLVSHSDFVVFDADFFSVNLYGFYPGINPLNPDRALPLLDIFPELASIDIDVIHDLASVDGYLYMTLSGADGTFLFGARDPSVIVPEPTAILLASIAALLFVSRRTHRF